LIDWLKRERERELGFSEARRRRRRSPPVVLFLLELSWRSLTFLPLLGGALGRRSNARVGVVLRSGNHGVVLVLLSERYRGGNGRRRRRRRRGFKREQSKGGRASSSRTLCALETEPPNRSPTSQHRKPTERNQRCRGRGRTSRKIPHDAPRPCSPLSPSSRWRPQSKRRKCGFFRKLVRLVVRSRRLRYRYRPRFSSRRKQTLVVWSRCDRLVPSASG